MTNGMRIYKNIALILAIIILTAGSGFGAVSYGAASNDKGRLEITLVRDKAGITANGIVVSAPKPFAAENVLYIPMKAVLETMGADVETSADGDIRVTYRDVAAEIRIGSNRLVVNQANLTLPAPPVLSGTTVMVPLDFLKLCFNVNTTYDKATGRAVILLESDGSLSDLSFLTGSIMKARVGNSYFGWSIALPKGTRTTLLSFNSKEVQFENEHYGIAISVAVELNKGKTLQQYFDQLEEDPYSVLGVELIDASVYPDASPQYIELLYTSSYNEAVYERIYAKDDKFISVSAVSFSEANPAVLLKNKAVKAAYDSFSLSYKGNSADTAELSKVNFGLAPYYNYISSETTGKKYLTWEMSVLPEWDLRDAQNPAPFFTQFDGNPGEYVKVEVQSAGDNTDIGSIGKKMAGLYEKNFNPAYFKMNSFEEKQTAGYASYSMQFEVKYGSRRYGYEERLILSDGIVYDITFKTPVEVFAKKRDAFDKMLETFKPAAKDRDKIQTELQKTAFNESKNRIGKDDKAVQYENKAYKWKLSLPGYWMKSSSTGQSFESFYDKSTGATVMVEASALKGSDSEKPDQERFLSMRLSDRMSEEPVKTYTEQVKGRNVKAYQYRIDDEENDNFADVTFYVFDEGGYRYCFTKTIPDLTSSEFNINSLNTIWQSFEIVK